MKSRKFLVLTFCFALSAGALATPATLTPPAGPKTTTDHSQLEALKGPFKNVLAMVRYYGYGIFVNAPHPFRKSAAQKHNPLQRLAYLALLAFISPLIWVSGLFYLFYGNWRDLGLDQYLSLEAVAIAHTFGAFMMAAFFFAHVYLTTTGHSVFAHIEAMITGWEEEQARH